MQTEMDKLKYMMAAARTAGIDVNANVAQIIKEVTDVCVATIGPTKTKELLIAQVARITAMPEMTN